MNPSYVLLPGVSHWFSRWMRTMTRPAVVGLGREPALAHLRQLACSP